MHTAAPYKVYGTGEDNRVQHSANFINPIGRATVHMFDHCSDQTLPHCDRAVRKDRDLGPPSYRSVGVWLLPVILVIMLFCILLFPFANFVQYQRRSTPR